MSGNWMEVTSSAWPKKLSLWIWPVRELFYFPPINNSTTTNKNLSKLDRKRCNIYASLLLSLEINSNFVAFVIVATKIRARATCHEKPIYSATFFGHAEHKSHSIGTDYC
jgi:hypothetical protein